MSNYIQYNDKVAFHPGYYLQEIVENSGTASCIVCRSAAEVKRTVNKQRVSTVVCGFKLPDEEEMDEKHKRFFEED